MTKKSEWWDYYIRGTSKYGEDGTHWKAYCKACVRSAVRTRKDAELAATVHENAGIVREDEVIRAEVLERNIVPAISGKVDRLIEHVLECPHGENDLKEKARAAKKGRRTQRLNKENMGVAPPPTSIFPTPTPTQPQSSSSAMLSPQSSLSTLADSSSTPSVCCTDTGGAEVSFGQKRKRIDNDDAPFYGETRGARPVQCWPDSVQEEFAADLCRLMVACNIAWWAVEHPYLRFFFSKWLPAAVLPGRTTLSERVLKQEAAKVEEQMKREVSGRFATGQCDGWTNIAKSSLVASVINVEYSPWLLNVFNVSAARKTAENLLSHVRPEIEYCDGVLSATVVAWCTDASGESKKMRNLLRREFPWIVTLNCWAHQVNLVVLDYFKLKGHLARTMDTALEIVKWFNHHSWALGILGERQKERTGTVLALLIAVVTRWTSRYLSCSRLLQLKNTICSLVYERYDDLVDSVGNKNDLQAKARDVLDKVLDRSFWESLTILRSHLEPLAIAANVTQANNARLDVVLLMLANLHRIFNDPSVSEDVRQQVVQSLEKRWVDTDQDIFVLAVVLNPYLRRDYFNPANLDLTEAELWQKFRRVFRRMVRRDVTFEAMQAFGEYVHRVGQFSDESMGLEEIKRHAQDTGQDINLIAVWRRFDCGYAQGRNDIVALAMRILSIVPNSAATERFFSKMGVVHSKLRSRLKPEKVRLTVLLREDIERRYPRPIRRKGRHFSSNKTTGDLLDDSDDESELDDVEDPNPTHSASDLESQPSIQSESTLDILSRRFPDSNFNGDAAGINPGSTSTSQHPCFGIPSAQSAPGFNNAHPHVPPDPNAFSHTSHYAPGTERAHPSMRYTYSSRPGAQPSAASGASGSSFAPVSEVRGLSLGTLFDSSKSLTDPLNFWIHGKQHLEAEMVYYEPVNLDSPSTSI